MHIKLNHKASFFAAYSLQAHIKPLINNPQSIKKMKRIIKTTLTFLLGAFAVALACTAPANNTTPPTSTLMAPPASTDIAPHTDTNAPISAAMPAAGAFGAEEDWAVDDLAKMLRLKEKKDDYVRVHDSSIYYFHSNICFSQYCRYYYDPFTTDDASRAP
mgnify:CR=1 FL=1